MLGLSGKVDLGDFIIFGEIYDLGFGFREGIVAIEHKSAQESGEEAQFLLVAHFKPDQIGGIAVHGLGDLHIWDSPELLICGLLINEIVQFFIEYPAAEQSYGAKIVFGKNIQ